ncbi:MAG: class I SAM-dependent methyltransferase [Nitrospirales bacterium]|nr:methyltransferase domain-containing protein [Nitrospirales bacterium]
MGDRTWSLSGLAKRVKASQRGVEILCRNLTSIGLLNYEDGRYRSSHMARRYLNMHSPEFRGAYLELLQRQWEDWSKLTSGIRIGKPVDEDKPETAEYRQSFTWAMHQRSVETARQVTRQLPLTKARSFLDLGGGPGTYALHFLKRNSSLRATIMDRPAALEVAKTLAKRYRLQSRMNFVPGDFLTESIPWRYDVVWYSNVLHIYSPKENLKVFRNVKRSLVPGGRIFIQDTFMQNPHGLGSVEANIFAVTMLLYTKTGNTYSVQDVKRWLQRAGFSRTKTHRLRQGTGDWEGIILEGRIPD